MATFVRKEDVNPICSHCKRELTTLWFHAVSGDLGKRCVYFCPHCRMVLGVSHRKGLIFGL